MTAIPATARAGLHGATTALLGLAAALVVLDAAAAAATGATAAAPALSITFTLAMAGMLLAGAVLARDRRHAGLGRLLLGIAATGALFDLAGTLLDLGPAAFLQGFVYWLYAALLIHLVVRWPDRRIEGRVARALVLAAYVVPALLSVLWQLTWDPRWYEGVAQNRWWLTLLPARGFSAAVWQTQQVLFVALVAALVVVIGVRAAAARGDRLAVLAPVVLVAVVLAVTVVVQVAQSVGAVLPLDVSLLQNLVLLAVPVAVLIAAVRAPAAVDAPAAPGRRTHLDDAARDRYRLGLAAGAAGLVVVVAVLVGVSSGGWPDSPAAPQPGPEVVAP